MSALASNSGTIVTTSSERPVDPFCAYWLEQGELRIRRELSWLWRNHGPVDWVAEALERRASEEKRNGFFAEDQTARYISQQIAELGPEPQIKRAPRGSFAWVARQLHLTPGEIFVTALALLAARDASAGTLFSALHADSRNRLPTLGLAQWLWHAPEQLLALTRGTHPLYRLGILEFGEKAGGDEWSATLAMPTSVVQSFLGNRTQLPEYLEKVAGVEESTTPIPVEMELLARRMASAPDAMRIVPVAVPYGGPLDASAAAPALRQLASRTRRRILAPRPGLRLTSSALAAMGTVCWLSGADLLLPSHGLPAEEQWQAALDAAPIYVFTAAGAGESTQSASERTLPQLRIPVLTVEESLRAWDAALKKHRVNTQTGAQLGDLTGNLTVLAQRFRFSADAIGRVASSLGRAANAPVDRARLILACEQEIGLQIGSNARLVAPRFTRPELVLDAERSRQFDELVGAMEHIAEVHSAWGTGRAWGNAGISALFAGAPGTGKTMAAEVLAAQLQLPMYRIDLSQVVNKYIGETEKNLRRLFDAGEQADVLLFFDEADALFGQRTQVRSSNDRFANLEVSYLLERMENFRGLAVLATNRKKDLDEAFLRRLRYVIEFPLPGEAERASIWRKAIPAEVSVDGIEFDTLSREFALSGGHIRSIVLNACLQAAAQDPTSSPVPSPAPRLTMENLMRGIAREFEKLGRPLSAQQRESSQPSKPAPPARIPEAR